MTPDSIDPMDGATPNEVALPTELQPGEGPQSGKKRKRPRWPIKRRYREAVMAHLAMLAIDRNSTPTAVCSAAKSLLTADTLNQKDELRPDADWDGVVHVFSDTGWYGNNAHELAALAAAKAKEKEAAQDNPVTEKEGKTPERPAIDSRKPTNHAR
jgi:hypothetical protein